MIDLYMKQLTTDGSGNFTVVKLGAETEEGINEKRAIFQGDDWQEATEDEYVNQFVNRKARVTGEADIALESKAPEAAPVEAPAEAPAPAEPQPEAQPEAQSEAEGQEGVEAES